jgi:hypothetical protein
MDHARLDPRQVPWRRRLGITCDPDEDDSDERDGDDREWSPAAMAVVLRRPSGKLE